MAKRSRQLPPLEAIRPEAPTVRREFYLLPPEIVAARLLGKLLIRRLERDVLCGRIVEVEAYLGADDPAAHAFVGKTARNAVVFGPPGYAYVYFIYGMHYCLNVSCEPEGQAGCVLIRALEPVCGLDQMARLRGLAPGAAPDPRLLTSGPGRLCQAMKITRAEHNGIDLTDAASPLSIVDDGYRAGAIDVTPRIGIRRAADRPLRFSVAASPFVTRASRVRAATS
jgi:DNA-3-methyladenine glycosylase